MCGDTQTIFIMSFTMLLFIFILIQSNAFSFIILINCAIGAFTFALLPLALELGVEITYPDVPEATSNNILWSFGQLGGILILLLFDDFNTRHLIREGLWLFSSCSVACLLPIYFFKATTQRRT